MKRSFPLLVLVCFSLPSFALLSAAPLTRDLGQGLVYHRLTTLPGDLPTVDSARQQPCVLDVRYVRGEAAAGTALDAWLRFRASPRSPVFLLINGETESAVLAALAARLPTAGIVVIGTASPGLAPDLALVVTPADERRAYEALAAGSPVESLLNDNPEKSRDDEARLSKDYLQRADPARTAVSLPPEDSPPATVTGEKKPPAEPTRPLTDAALQRAVHLHRALKALKKL